jgi:hypothetical protein
VAPDGLSQPANAEQVNLLETAGQLQPVESPRWMNNVDGTIRVNFDLPLHGVSLVFITW